MIFGGPSSFSPPDPLDVIQRQGYPMCVDEDVISKREYNMKLTSVKVIWTELLDIENKTFSVKEANELLDQLAAAASNSALAYAKVMVVFKFDNGEEVEEKHFAEPGNLVYFNERAEELACKLRLS